MENKNELVITRTFDAPQEQVWKAWIEPELIKKWWGPKDFTCPAANIDFKVGGKSHVAMHGPKGSEFDKDLWSTGTYKEIVPMGRIVTTDSFADEKDNVVSAEHYGMSADFPLELQVTLMFEELPANKTRMTLQHVGFPAGKEQEDAKAGWNQSFDKLAEILKGGEKNE
ncbi:MAG: hypothetical protein A2Z24_01835 [Candidatus Woykebacteria bacterium RBG_16_44_10]|uniref:Activator of Hsp90 ATPase homologue 1/2-like C-terminal domain-containing protein n=1 Tax=Candidatus Woykebacteria bacterium RBG_16_44_10 TaxID=1802597 RepID=A0A1G1WFV2_9BACT|nr:MAG: hypothetical protein A2Z24_01835 [Candidatus Woykebacteria bacterium RBG_16_44_10]